MTLLIVLLLAAVLMSQIKVPQRWALVIVVTLVMGVTTFFPAW